MFILILISVQLHLIDMSYLYIFSQYLWKAPLRRNQINNLKVYTYCSILTRSYIGKMHADTSQHCGEIRYLCKYSSTDSIDETLFMSRAYVKRFKRHNTGPQKDDRIFLQVYPQPFEIVAEVNTCTPLPNKLVQLCIGNYNRASCELHFALMKLLHKVISLFLGVSAIKAGKYTQWGLKAEDEEEGLIKG